MTDTPTHSDSALGVLAEILALHRQSEGPLLPILHALQHHFGYIPAELLKPLAEALMMTEAEVWGVVSFYHDFRKEPAGQHVLKICRAEACQCAGGDVLAERMRARAGVAWGETTPDGRLTIEPVYCLGLCACAPAAMLDGKLIGRLDDLSTARLMAEAGI